MRDLQIRSGSLLAILLELRKNTPLNNPNRPNNRGSGKRIHKSFSETKNSELSVSNKDMELKYQAAYLDSCAAASTYGFNAYTESITHLKMK